jgi:tripartite-type tricarboxylate transporter receptor subunit TctC
MAPKDTPKPVVDLLNRTITEILSRPALKEAWEKQGARPFTMSQPDYEAFMQAQVEKWAKVIEANHITLIN